MDPERGAGIQNCERRPESTDSMLATAESREFWGDIKGRLNMVTFY